ncbi:MAG TPA: hypothetical protein VGJ03_08520 [Acidimicrobiales bacterium]
MDEPTEGFNIPPGATSTPGAGDAPEQPPAPQASPPPSAAPGPYNSPAMPPLGLPYAMPAAPPAPTFPASPPENWPSTPPLLPVPVASASPPGGGGPREPSDPRRSALVIAALGAVAIVLVGLLAWQQSSDNGNGRFIAGAPSTTQPVATDGNSDSTSGSDSSGSSGSTDSSGQGNSSSDSSSSSQEDLQQVVLDIQAFVARERGLAFKQNVDVQLATDDQLQQMLDDELSKEQASITEEQEVLRALGLVPPTFDVVQAEKTLDNGSVLGFYDPETKKLVVRGTDITPFVREVIAHELTHALDDQWFNLDRPQLDTADDETGFAFSALTEGDATRIEEAYLDSLSPHDRAQASSEEQQLLFAHPEVFSLPQALVDIAQEPYTDGPALVSDILDAGQQPRLDAAFQQPPTTSEQVINPDKFLAGEGAVPLPFPAADGTVSNKGVLGAFMFEELLVGSSQTHGIDQAIDGWGGDEYVTWIGADGKTCLRDTFVGDTPADTAQLANALSEWAPDTGATIDAPAGQPGTLTVCS